MKKGSTKTESSEFASNVGNLLTLITECKAELEWDAAIIETGLSFAELTPAFLNKLRDLVKAKVKDGDLSADDWNEAVRKARAHAGGKGKAAKSRSEEADVEMSEDNDTMNVLDICKKGGSFRLFNEYDFADPPEWMPLMPKPGKYKHPDYGLIELDEKRLDRFLANVNDGVYQSKLPINAEHKPSEDGAFGWITEARKNSDGSIDGKVKWTDLGSNAIENDHYMYVSPEWLDAWKQASTGKTINDVLIGAALTVRPFFKEDSMRPLIASERGLLTVSGADHKKLLQSNGNCVIFAQTLSEVKQMAEMKKCAIPGCDNDAMPGKKMCEMHMKEKGMAEADNAELKQATEKIGTLEGTVKTLSETVTAQTEQLKLATETIGNQNAIINRMVTDARQKEFNEIVKGFPGNKDSHIDVLELYFEKHKCSEPGKCACGSADCKGGKESKQFTDYVTQQKAFADQIKTAREFGDAGLFGEIGSSAGGDGPKTAAEKLDVLAKEHVSKNPKLTYHQAYSEVCDQHPDLYAQHRKEAN